MARLLIKEIRLPITEDSVSATDFAQKKLAELFGRENVGKAEIYRKSLDARHRDKITAVYSVAAEVCGNPSPELLVKEGISLIAEDTLELNKGSERMAGRPVIVGNGPCGMFCALLLAENGYRPIVIERGDPVEKRVRSVKDFYRTKILDTGSNIQFGAGGAGTFSDGKLVTRINDARCRYVLKRFTEFGAPESVLVSSKPHIGTDLLTGIVAEINRKIVLCGGEIRYRTALKGFNRASDGRITSVKTSDGDIPCSAVVLAVGNSARDVYEYLIKSGICVTEKALSVGLRIEHLRSDIENSLFGRDLMRKAESDKRLREMLGHAEYAYSYRENGRAVYTFCMCPGGEVVCGSSENLGVVVNGMSRSRRDGVNSNCAVCVSVTPDDLKPFGGVMEFCRGLEKNAFRMGGGKFAAPVETVGDYLSGKSRGFAEPSEILPTYMGGSGNVKVCDLSRLFPEFVDGMLKKGIMRFGKNLKGFDAPGAVLTGVETRTSAPYRIVRGEDGTSPSAPNLYPAGEGSGYSGGITSSAVDGIACAEKIIASAAPLM